MTDPEFMDRAEALLRRIEACCDRINDETDADIDNQRFWSGAQTPQYRYYSPHDPFGSIPPGILGHNRAVQLNVGFPEPLTVLTDVDTSNITAGLEGSSPGTDWTWDARLTSSALLAILLAG